MNMDEDEVKSFVSGLGLTIALDSLIFIAVMIPWALIRRKFPSFYYPKQRNEPIQQTLYKWILPLLSVRGDDLFRQVGVKGVIFLRYKLHATLFIIVLGLCSLFFMVMYNLSASTTQAWSFFESLSASSIAPDSWMIWSTFAYTVFITVGFVVVIVCHRKDVKEIKQKGKSKSFIFHRVISITGLSIAQTSEDLLKQQLEACTGARVKQVSLAWKIDDIDDLLDRKALLEHKLEIYQAEELNSGKAYYINPSIIERLRCKAASRAQTSAVTYYEGKLNETLKEINQKREEAYQRISTGVAFVVYHNSDDAYRVVANWNELVQDAPNDFDFEHCTVETAKPHPEIIWKNLGYDLGNHKVSRITFDCVIVLLSLFWSIPIVFLSNLDNLAQIPYVGDTLSQLVNWNIIIKDLTQRYLPAILTWIFYQLLPRFCVWLSKKELHSDISSVHASAMEKYWIFIMLNGYIFFLLFSSGIEMVETLMNTPEKVYVVLENLNWPQYGAFYCNYLITLAFIDTAFKFLQLKQQFLKHFSWIFTPHKFEAQKELIFRAGNMSYYTLYAKESLYLAMIMTFTPIVPVVSLCAILCYIMNIIADKYIVVLVVPQEYSLGGKMILRFAIFTNCSIVLTFVFWTFFFLSHSSETFLPYIAAGTYITIWVICLYAIRQSKKDIALSSPHSSAEDEFVTQDDEIFYDWDYATSPDKKGILASRIEEM